MSRCVHVRTVSSSAREEWRWWSFIHEKDFRGTEEKLLPFTFSKFLAIFSCKTKCRGQYCQGDLIYLWYCRGGLCSEYQ